MNTSEKLMSLSKISEDTSTSREIKFMVVEHEVVSRSNKADLILHVLIDMDKIDKAAKLSAASDVDYDGNPIKYQDSHAVCLKDAENELKKVSKSNISVSRDGTLSIPENNDYLIFEVRQDGHVKHNDLSDVDFDYDSGEVHRTKDPEYQLK